MVRLVWGGIGALATILGFAMAVGVSYQSLVPNIVGAAVLAVGLLLMLWADGKIERLMGRVARLARRFRRRAVSASRALARRQARFRGSIYLWRTLGVRGIHRTRDMERASRSLLERAEKFRVAFMLEVGLEEALRIEKGAWRLILAMRSRSLGVRRKAETLLEVLKLWQAAMSDSGKWPKFLVAEMDKLGERFWETVDLAGGMIRGQSTPTATQPPEAGDPTILSPVS